MYTAVSSINPKITAEIIVMANKSIKEINWNYKNNPAIKKIRQKRGQGMKGTNRKEIARS